MSCNGDGVFEMKPRLVGGIVGMNDMAVPNFLEMTYFKFMFTGP